MQMVYDGADRALWLEARKAPARDGYPCLSASEASVILGLNPWQTELELWARKRGLVGEVEDNDAMRWGRILEPVVIAEYATRLPAGHVARPSSAIYAHPDLDWLRATPDGFVEFEGRVVGGIEAKTTGSQWEDGLPIYYDSQARVQMSVCRLPWDDVPVLAAGKFFDVHRVDADDAIEHEIIERLAEWRDRHLVRGEEPKAEPSDGKILRDIYGKSRPVVVSLGDEGAWLHGELSRIGSEIAELMNQKEALTAMIQAKMRDAQYALNADGTCFSWKEQKQPIMEKVGERMVRVFRRAKSLPKGVTV